MYTVDDGSGGGSDDDDNLYMTRMFFSYLLLLWLQLQMLGYDISWAGFNIIEVMSSAKFTYKRIGYLSSSQSFHSDTEVSVFVFSILT